MKEIIDNLTTRFCNCYNIAIFLYNSLLNFDSYSVPKLATLQKMNKKFYCKKQLIHVSQFKIATQSNLQEIKDFLRKISKFGSLNYIKTHE